MSGISVVGRRRLRRARADRLFPLLLSGFSCFLGLWILAAEPYRTAWARADDERPQPPVEAYEWSVWVGSPAQLTLNGSRTYKNAMPSVVGTIRPKLEGKDAEGKFPIAPISVVQFFGEPYRDITDIDLRVKKGNILAHWPPGQRTVGSDPVVQVRPHKVAPG